MLDLLKETHKGMWVIFDLDGTIADISQRREVSEKENGKLDWDKFFNSDNIGLDKPFIKIITLVNMFNNIGVNIAILSGRCKSTKEATQKWLKLNNVPYNILKMRPTSTKWKFMPDDKLKKIWLDDLWPEQEREGKLLMVFDDRQKVVDMWRENNITCLQVAKGNF
tara:strand:+ start:157 stop:654 length:498 start_codon:yes stop_codon:yes gene_type:complete